MFSTIYPFNFSVFSSCFSFLSMLTYSIQVKIEHRFFDYTFLTSNSSFYIHTWKAKNYLEY